MRYRILLPLLGLISSALAAENRLGYQYSAASAGGTHYLGYEWSQGYFAIGALAGYGTGGISVKTEFSDSNGVPNGNRVSMHKNGSFKIDLPLKLRYPKWPYLVVKLGYERIVALDPALRGTGKSGFAKSNDLFLYPGAGYEWTLKRKFGIYLNGLTRFPLAGAGKRPYYTIEPALLGSGNRIGTVKEMDSGFAGRIFWDAGVRYLF